MRRRDMTLHEVHNSANMSYVWNIYPHHIRNYQCLFVSANDECRNAKKYYSRDKKEKGAEPRSSRSAKAVNKAGKAKAKGRGKKWSDQ